MNCLVRKSGKTQTVETLVWVWFRFHSISHSPKFPEVCIWAKWPIRTFLCDAPNSFSKYILIWYMCTQCSIISNIPKMSPDLRDKFTLLPNQQLPEFSLLFSNGYCLKMNSECYFFHKTDTQVLAFCVILKRIDRCSMFKPIIFGMYIKWFDKWYLFNIYFAFLHFFKSNLWCYILTFWLGNQDRKDQLDKTRLLLAELPSCNRTLLAWLFTHMSHVIEKVWWLI